MVDATVERDVVAAGCEVEQLVAREDPAGMAGERLHQRELAGAETNGAAVRMHHRVGAAIDPPGAEAQHGGARATAAQDHVDACDQLLGLARLDQIVVGARLQTGDAVGRVAMAGEQQDAGIGRQRAQVPRQRQAVLVGQGHVEHDQIGGFRLDQAPQLGTGTGFAHAVAGAGQHPCQEHAHLLIVLDRDQFRQLVSFLIELPSKL